MGVPSGGPRRVARTPSREGRAAPLGHGEGPLPAEAAPEATYAPRLAIATRKVPRAPPVLSGQATAPASRPRDTAPLGPATSPT